MSVDWGVELEEKGLGFVGEGERRRRKRIKVGGLVDEACVGRRSCGRRQLTERCLAVKERTNLKLKARGVRALAKWNHCGDTANQKRCATSTCPHCLQ